MSISKELEELINSTAEKSVEEGISLPVLYEQIRKRKNELKPRLREVSCIVKNEDEEKFKAKAYTFVKEYGPRAKTADITWTTAILCLFYRSMKEGKTDCRKQEYVAELMGITEMSEATCRARLNGQQGKFLLDRYFSEQKCRLLVLDYKERNEFIERLVLEIQKN